MQTKVLTVSQATERWASLLKGVARGDATHIEYNLEGTPDHAGGRPAVCVLGPASIGAEILAARGVSVANAPTISALSSSGLPAAVGEVQTRNAVLFVTSSQGPVAALYSLGEPQVAEHMRLFAATKEMPARGKAVSPPMVA